MGTRRADAASGADLGRQPNGKVNGFGQVLGKVKCHFLHRIVEERCREVERRFKRRGCTGVTHQAATRTMATAVIMVTRAIRTRVLVFGIARAGSLRLFFGTAGLFGSSLLSLCRVFGMFVATSPSTVHRSGEQAEE